MTASQPPAASPAPPYLGPYHIDTQHADALLGPIVAALGELEGRTTRYAERLTLSESDRDAIQAATRALAAARAEITRLAAE